MKLELQKGSRSKILAVLIVGITAIFIVRLFYLQVIQHNYYVKQAAAEQVKITDIPAQRGLIYGLNGSTVEPLALNQTVYTVFADPQTVVDNSKVISTIESVAGGNAEPNLEGLLNNKKYLYEVLATDVTYTQAQKIKAANLNGVGFQAINQRVYPEGALGAQVLGFVTNTGQGAYGVEGGLNSELSGTDGVLKAVTDVNDVPLTIGSDNIDKPAVNGKKRRSHDRSQCTSRGGTGAV